MTKLPRNNGKTRAATAEIAALIRNTPPGETVKVVGRHGHTHHVDPNPQPESSDTMQLERKITEWHEERWPEKDDCHVGAKLAEETGEVCGALIKLAEDRRDKFDVLDEMGDVLIVLSVLAGRMGVSLEEVRARRWAEVSNR